jgi:hypothetical protein
MPLTRISVPQHLRPEKIRALADAVHAGLTGTCNVPDKDRFQLVTRFEAGMMILDPTYLGVTRTGDACVVEILFLKGRTQDQKRRLFAKIVEEAVAGGFAADDILIGLSENGIEDWSLGKGVAFGDVAHKAPGI